MWISGREFKNLAYRVGELEYQNKARLEENQTLRLQISAMLKYLGLGLEYKVPENPRYEVFQAEKK